MPEDNILTPTMAKTVLEMVCSVSIPAGHSHNAIRLIEALKAIMSGATVVVPAAAPAEVQPAS